MYHKRKGCDQEGVRIYALILPYLEGFPVQVHAVTQAACALSFHCLLVMFQGRLWLLHNSRSARLIQPSSMLRFSKIGVHVWYNLIYLFYTSMTSMAEDLRRNVLRNMLFAERRLCTFLCFFRSWLLSLRLLRNLLPPLLAEVLELCLCGIHGDARI